MSKQAIFLRGFSALVSAFVARGPLLHGDAIRFLLIFEAKLNMLCLSLLPLWAYQAGIQDHICCPLASLPQSVAILVTLIYFEPRLKTAGLPRLP